MSLETKPVFEFGPFRLDVAERRLSRGPTPIHLPPKAFDSLVELVKSPGHLLEKEALLNALWPGIFVEESNLAQHISTLRKALQDGESGQRYIETVSGRGYRFVAPVAVHQQASNGSHIRTQDQAAPLEPEFPPAQDIAAVTPAHVQSSKRHPLISVGIVSLLAVSLLSYVFWNRSRVSDPRPITSLAVLPLQNLSGDPTKDYFADGMTESLITDLAKIGSVRVISRTSAMQYKGSHLPLPEIAKQLNVDVIVEGSVLQSGDRVRVTAQLIRASDDLHLWADSFERDGRDVLLLQGDIARSIADNIKLKLTPIERAQLSHRREVDPQALEAYLRGRYFWNKRTVDDYQKSILSFQEAIHRDPNYAEAYAGLADAYALMGSSGNPALSRADAMEKARVAALTALRLDEGLAQAHTSLAFVRMHYDWSFASAEKEFRRAIELNPSYATAHHWHAYNLVATGHREEALTELEAARNVDPLSPILNTDVAEFLSYLRRYDQAIHQVNKALELDPNFYLAYMRLQAIYDEQRNFADSLIEARKGLALSPENSWTLSATSIEEFRAHHNHNAGLLLDRLIQLSRSKEVASDVAAVYAAMEHKDDAFAWLEKSFQQRSGALILLRADRRWDNLRSDPRFDDLCRRVGLPN